MVNNQPGPSRVPNLSTLLGLSCIIKVVDIGANPIDGPTPYASLLAAGCAEIVGFEPNPEALAELDRQKGPREDQLLRLAVILHDCYAAYDLVAHLLLARDRRIGTDLGHRYVRLARGVSPPSAPPARPA